MKPYMRYLISMAYCLFILSLTACNTRSQPVLIAHSVVDNTSTTTGITEYAALQLLLEALELRQVATDCLGFRSDNNTDENTVALVWEFAAIEIHDEICGGDPHVGHVRNIYRVSSDGSLMVYDAANAEYKPF